MFKNIFIRSIVGGAGFAIGILCTTVLAVTVSGTFHSFAPGDLVSASMINDNFTRLKTAVENVHEVPVGTIAAWHKNFYGTPPALPVGWVECNGQVISDSDSPFNGQTIPDLNGGGRFLRGGGTSGANQADELKSHNHSFKATTDSSGVGSPQAGHCSIQTTDRVAGCTTGDADATVTNLIYNNGGTETRPINMSVVWIIKIK